MSGTEVINSQTAFAIDGFEGSYMSGCKVAYVDIIAHACTIVGVVIIAENAQLLADTYCGLRDIRHEVIGDTIGVLAHRSGWMRTYGIKITEQYDIPLIISLLYVNQHFLQHRLGLAVRVRAMPLGAVFRNRDNGRIAINGSRRRENQILATMLAHHVEQYKGRVHVVLIILQRLAHRFAYSFEAGKMDNGINLIVRENLLHSRSVAYVSLYERHLFADDLSHSAKRFGIGITKVINYYHIVAGLVELNNGVAADKASTARKKNIHILRIYFRINEPLANACFAKSIIAQARAVGMGSQTKSCRKIT